MDALTRKDVEEIALLARLELSDAEIDRLGGELTAILAHMDKLAELDVGDTPPMTHAVPMALRLRDDAPGESLPAEQAVSQAPDRDDDQFRVPHIIPAAK